LPTLGGTLTDARAQVLGIEGDVLQHLRDHNELHPVQNRLAPARDFDDRRGAA
jgi:hypothetical protein